MFHANEDLNQSSSAYLDNSTAFFGISIYSNLANFGYFGTKQHSKLYGQFISRWKNKFSMHWILITRPFQWGSLVILIALYSTRNICLLWALYCASSSMHSSLVLWHWHLVMMIIWNVGVFVWNVQTKKVWTDGVLCRHCTILFNHKWGLRGARIIVMYWV